MGHCPSITSAFPIQPLPKCSQAGALQTKLFVLSRPASAPASRSISPNCLQIAKAELPPKSRHALSWLESRLSPALQMLMRSADVSLPPEPFATACKESSSEIQLCPTSTRSCLWRGEGRDSIPALGCAAAPISRSCFSTNTRPGYF